MLRSEQEVGSLDIVTIRERFVVAQEQACPSPAPPCHDRPRPDRRAVRCDSDQQGLKRDSCSYQYSLLYVPL
jgi:hypothetical protein